MAVKHRFLFVSALWLGFTAGAVAAGETAPVEPLILAAEAARDLIAAPPASDTEFAQAAGPEGGPEAQAVGGSGLIRPEQWQIFSAPDPQTLAWLASRMPGVDAANVRVVPGASADGAMQRAIAAGASYVDLLSDPALQRGRSELYYVPQDALLQVDQKYLSGTLPASGMAKDGRPFKMQAIVGGAGNVTFLYDRTDEFTFQSDGYDIKIAAGGKVSSQIHGSGDIGSQGVSGCMRVVVYVCAQIQRTTKVSADQIRVETSRGPQTKELRPIRSR